MIRSRRALLSAALVALSPLAGPALGAEQHAPRPRPGSLEYRLSWGVGATRASRAYRAGATGRGVIVAMVDTGVDAASARLFGHLSPESIDLVPGRRADRGDRSHGVETAGLIAARLDGEGTFGIAYDATLLSIRADRDGSCATICSFDPAVLARAIDYAVDHGAAVIGLPLSATKRIPALEAPLARAVAAGAVIVAAAGNDGTDQPVWPARYAADPRFAPAMIVAGATTLRGRLAAWSNRAGAARERFVGAPGEQILVDCNTRTCRLTSGTSYSVAYTAGAVALLLSRAPGLSPPSAAAALLDSADDLAARGPDAATGRGRLDVARAVRAVERVAAD